MGYRSSCPYMQGAAFWLPTQAIDCLGTKLCVLTNAWHERYFNVNRRRNAEPWHKASRPGHIRRITDFALRVKDAYPDGPEVNTDERPEPYRYLSIYPVI